VRTGGTVFGNMMERRYLQSTKYVKGAAMFQTYGSQYDVRRPAGNRASATSTRSTQTSMPGSSPSAS